VAGTPDLINAYAELNAARPAYAKAEAYYDGAVDEIYASAAVERMLAKSNLDELDELNFARIPVDAVANRLHITAITTGNDSADADIEELATRNELAEEAPALHVRGCTLGDAYLMVWPEYDAAGEMLGVNMYCNSPFTARVIYDEEHPLRKKLGIRAWTVGSGKERVIRADLYYPDPPPSDPNPESNPARIERWLWSEKEKNWEPWRGDGQDAVLPNPWGAVPFFHFRTSRPYGRPVHRAAFGAQGAINKIIMGHLATIDWQSLPQRYGLIDPAIDQSGAQTDFDPNFPEDEEADPESPNNPSQLRNDPGEFWQLQGYKDVGQFSAADPDVYLKPLDRYIKAMSQVTGVPFTLFDSTGDAISGEARQEAKADLTARVEAIQRSFGATWASAWKFALRILGHDDLPVTVRWQPADQVSTLDGWTTIEAKIRNGVPREQALIEAGYPPEVVHAWLSGLDDDAELQRRVDLLASLGAAVQALGTGVTLGAITEQQVTTLLNGVLGATVALDSGVGT
jgi:hypothetical protein